MLQATRVMNSLGSRRKLTPALEDANLRTVVTTPSFCISHTDFLLPLLIRD